MNQPQTDIAAVHKLLLNYFEEGRFVRFPDGTVTHTGFAEGWELVGQSLDLSDQMISLVFRDEVSASLITIQVAPSRAAEAIAENELLQHPHMSQEEDVAAYVSILVREKLETDLPDTPIVRTVREC